MLDKAVYINTETHHGSLCQNESNRTLGKWAFSLKSDRLHQKPGQTPSKVSSQWLSPGKPVWIDLNEEPFDLCQRFSLEPVKAVRCPEARVPVITTSLFPSIKGHSPLQSRRFLFKIRGSQLTSRWQLMLLHRSGNAFVGSCLPFISLCLHLVIQGRGTWAIQTFRQVCSAFRHRDTTLWQNLCPKTKKLSYNEDIA